MPKKILFLVSGNNGLTQRATLALESAGHNVRVAVVSNEESMFTAVQQEAFDFIISPYLKTKIPEKIWQEWPTIIIHPGPIGDRGASSLDWAITNNEPIWGVTALQAVAEMDAGPIWASRTFAVPNPGVRKSALYNGPVADAALECILEVADKVDNSNFEPTPLAEMKRPVPSAQLLPTMKQSERSFSWQEKTSEIIRKIQAADGFPGVLTTLENKNIFVYDAHIGASSNKVPGTIIAHRDNAIQVATGDQSVWIGYARMQALPGQKTFKLPATQILNSVVNNVENLPSDFLSDEKDVGYQPIKYREENQIGLLEFDFYNGAMNTEQCQNLLKALQYALHQHTKVLVLSGGYEYFSNGIHLNVIEAAENPAFEAWRNIKAINQICRELITASSKLIIAAFTGNAGAGGVMMPLGADIVVARDGIVLNPHYATMGLFGSELHTYTLPKRVGSKTANRLTTECSAISVEQAQSIGLVDYVGPREKSDFCSWLISLASEEIANKGWEKSLATKKSMLERDMRKTPLDAFEARELGQMAQDMFDDRNGFAAKRRAFVLKL